MMSMVLRRWMLKSFFIFFIPGFANTAIPRTVFQGGYRESGIGKVLRVLSQCPKNTILEV